MIRSQRYGGSFQRLQFFCLLTSQKSGAVVQQEIYYKGKGVPLRPKKRSVFLDESFHKQQPELKLEQVSTYLSHSSLEHPPVYYFIMFD